MNNSLWNGPGWYATRSSATPATARLECDDTFEDASAAARSAGYGTPYYYETEAELEQALGSALGLDLTGRQGMRDE